MPKFLNLYEALELDFPVFATLPYVMGPDGKKKLSKRDGARDILDYKREGYLPEALVSFLATLGWNDGTEQETFTVDELIQKFDLSRVHHGGAKFDEQRLLWVNGHFIRQLSIEQLYKLAEPFWPESAAKASPEYKKAVLALVQERLKFLAELPGLTNFFFEEPDKKSMAEYSANPQTKKFESLLPSNNKRMVETVIEELQNSDFSVEDLKNRLNNLLDKLETNPRTLFSIIRIAITWTAASPDLFGTLHVLGKDKSLDRLRQSVSNLEK
jgi:glutamyl/glutaminyl-tRNA synthetase